MPPAAFTTSAAICAPTRQAWPGSAKGPVTGCTTPILNVFGCAPSGRGNPATITAAADLRNVRRLFVRIGEPPEQRVTKLYRQGRWVPRVHALEANRARHPDLLHVLGEARSPGIIGPMLDREREPETQRHGHRAQGRGRAPMSAEKRRAAPIAGHTKSRTFSSIWRR